MRLSNMKLFNENIRNSAQRNKVEKVVSKVQDFTSEFAIIEKLKVGKYQDLYKIPLEKRKPGYKREKEGGIGCYNFEELKCQEGLLLQFVKDFGKRLFEGKDIVSLSLPVKIFEPRSTLERICDNWAFMPIYLNMAANTKNKLERFKLTITFAISGLYNGCKQLKPFNPIIGETFQAFLPNGTSINIEHTSHHPPISHFLVVEQNNKYRFQGYYEYVAKLKPTNIIGSQLGPNILTFYDKQKIKWNFPYIKLSGLFFGTRVMECVDSMVFEDLENGFYCKIQFYEGGGFFAQNQHPSDYFEGEIINKFGNSLEPLSKVRGSWIDFIEFDGVRYWDLQVVNPVNLMKTDQPLPSDCRFRKDLLDLSSGDLELAQQSKIELEVLQRKEKADRKKATYFKNKLLGRIYENEGNY